MKAMRAHVQNGQIVLDEQVELPEGALPDVFLEEPEDLAELDAAVDESLAEFARGEFVEARTVAERLAAKP